MFEYNEAIVDTLLHDNQHFQELYKQHHDLKERVKSAERSAMPTDDVTLGTMKREKLHAKDKMAAIIEEYRREHA